MLDIIGVLFSVHKEKIVFIKTIQIHQCTVYEELIHFWGHKLKAVLFIQEKMV